MEAALWIRTPWPRSCHMVSYWLALVFLLYHAGFVSAALHSPGQIPVHAPSSPHTGQEQHENAGQALLFPPHQYNPLPDVRAALDVMQTSWFELWIGAWPTAIDWTAAVIHTHLVATLNTLSKALHVSISGDPATYHGPIYPDTPALVENDLNLYFAQTVAYYFGEDAFAIRNEAYDDMLWVVLGWLEATNFVRSHSQLHFVEPGGWHGLQFVDTFAHRARVFYSLASQGWDTDLCGGGMIWNPRLSPYKNTITNQLFISASVGMYLYFTGDNNDSPFATGTSSTNFSQPHDKQFLTAAIEGYDWLKNVDMLNDQGLYIDGYHISEWNRHRHRKGLACDVRNEEIYTYNQAVILSGLRSLWESTGDTTYLEDGHALVNNTITATGWALDKRRPSYSLEWSGIGRNGTLEETCDSGGTCSRDTHSFKGIYFNHLVSFCEPLPAVPKLPGITHGASYEVSSLHSSNCEKYSYWVEHNARAAAETRSSEGKFGMWWGATEEAVSVRRPKGAIDYRNDPTVLSAPLWGHSQEEQNRYKKRASNTAFNKPATGDDLNDRGRGRTVETQGGGLSVVRAWWEFANRRPV